MSSLFDSDDGSSSSEKSSFIDNGLGDDDDSTVFTVSTVLDNQGRRDKSRRDTITRKMPNISLDDKYAMPNTVQRKQRNNSGVDDDNRIELRVTESLMDDTSDEDDEDGEGNFRRRKKQPRISDITTKNSFGEDMFTPVQDVHDRDDFCNKSTTMRRNAKAEDEDSFSNQSKPTSLLDIEVDSQGELHNRLNMAKRRNRRDSSDTFMSVYEDLGTKQRTPAPSKAKVQTNKHGDQNGYLEKKVIVQRLNFTLQCSR